MSTRLSNRNSSAISAKDISSSPSRASIWHLASAQLLVAVAMETIHKEEILKKQRNLIKTVNEELRARAEDGISSDSDSDASYKMSDEEKLDNKDTTNTMSHWTINEHDITTELLALRQACTQKKNGEKEVTDIKLMAPNNIFFFGLNSDENCRECLPHVFDPVRDLIKVELQQGKHFQVIARECTNMCIGVEYRCVSMIDIRIILLLLGADIRLSNKFFSGYLFCIYNSRCILALLDEKNECTKHGKGDPAILYDLYVFADKRHTIDKSSGGPGQWSTPDLYNTISGDDWNRTYAPTEPQQIHLSIASEAEYAKVQFATTSEILKALFKYWPKAQNDSKLIVTIAGHEDWTFVDGGEEKRRLYLHNIKTNNLEPATVYQYQVGTVATNSTETTWSPIYEFHTQSDDDTFSFLATADVGTDNAVAVPHLIQYAKTHKYDFVTLSGDQAYNMADFNGEKGDEYMNFAQQLYARLPYLGAPGNHESAYNFSHYKNRFNIVPYETSKFADSMTYSFDYKSLHLISFSTEIYFEGTDDEIRTATNWLEADLQQAVQNRHIRPWIILSTHHPVYCSSNTEDCEGRSALIRDGLLSADNGAHWGGLEDLLLKYKVDVYLSGHVHNYERTYPVAKGLTTSTSYHNAPSFFQLLVGNGGQPEGAVPFNKTGPYPDWSVVRYGGYGFSTIKVSPTSMEIKHHEAKMDGHLGRLIDNFTVTKDLQ
ncbi:hypothetical protein DFQ30_006647 [Apophysomyces sp. BC1015]|nr:hypothetical protein DFQ30_006647 [Apophysomyces sp. BC1015]